MKENVLDIKGAKISAITLPAIFDIKVKPSVIHDYWLYVQAKSKLGLASTKGRGEVSGGGRKPWKQKGTGHSRQGSIRSPQWRGGGVVFGPTSMKNPPTRLNKKIRAQGLMMALATKFEDKAVHIISEIKVPSHKTKEFLNIIKEINTANTTLIILDKPDQSIKLATRNIPFVNVISPRQLNLEDIFNFESIIMDKESINTISKIWGKGDTAVEVKETVRHKAVKEKAVKEKAAAKKVA